MKGEDKRISGTYEIRGVIMEKEVIDGVVTDRRRLEGTVELDDSGRVLGGRGLRDYGVNDDWKTENGKGDRPEEFRSFDVGERIIPDDRGRIVGMNLQAGGEQYAFVRAERGGVEGTYTGMTTRKFRVTTANFLKVVIRRL